MNLLCFYKHLLVIRVVGSLHCLSNNWAVRKSLLFLQRTTARFRPGRGAVDIHKHSCTEQKSLVFAFMMVWVLDEVVVGLLAFLEDSSWESSTLCLISTLPSQSTENTANMSARVCFDAEPYSGRVVSIHSSNETTGLNSLSFAVLMRHTA